MLRRALILCVALVLQACTGAPSPVATESPTLEALDTATAVLEAITASPTESESTATLEAIASPEPATVFEMAVIVDTSSEPVTIEQAEAVFADAGKILVELTGVGLRMVDFVEDASGGSVDSMVRAYFESNERMPHGIVVFGYGENGLAKLNGGYARQILGPSGFRNDFVSSWIGDNQVYVAVVHYRHKYAACGYAGQDTIQRSVSSNSECRGVDGVACTEKHGYQMCATALEHLYASTPTYFAAATIVHEIMHSFSNRGVDDHYATASCRTVMGWDPSYFDFDEAQQFASMCPYVYDLFAESYLP